jgi:hypothetical protein
LVYNIQRRRDGYFALLLSEVGFVRDPGAWKIFLSPTIAIAGCYVRFRQRHAIINFFWLNQRREEDAAVAAVYVEVFIRNVIQRRHQIRGVEIFIIYQSVNSV